MITAIDILKDEIRKIDDKIKYHEFVLPGDMDNIIHLRSIKNYLNDALKRIQALWDGWIKCSERLPGHFEDIFFYDKYKKRYYAGWYDDEWFCTSLWWVQVNITHWRKVLPPHQQ